MSDYNTQEQCVSNLQEVRNQIASHFFKSATRDRSVIISSYIDTLINVGQAPSITKAAEIIGKDIGMNTTTVLNYYRGDK